MILTEYPYPWNSVHRPIPFVYDHEERTLFIVTSSGGLAVFWVQSPYNFTPVAGERIYIDSGIYEGYHTVTSVAGSLIATSTSFIGSDFSVPTVKYIRLPQIKVYCGYLSGEEYDDELPSELVATFTPENSPEIDVRFDVSEYLKSIFRIVAPTEGIDFNMFNRFRLFFDGVYHEFYMALNSSIKTDELNSDYVDTGAYLNSTIPPVVFGCGKTLLSHLQGNVVVNVVSNNGDITIEHADFSDSDFSSDFNIE